MISMMAFLLFLGLIVFGPKKTIEFAQEIGRLVAHVKHAAGQFQDSVLADQPKTIPPAPKPASSSPIE